MSDDEEVIIKNSELHKYMQNNDIVNLHANFEDKELSLEHYGCANVIQEDNDLTIQLKDNEVKSLCNKFEFSDYSGDVIYNIMRTGLLYPDHVAELDHRLQLKDIREVKVFQNNAHFYCSGLVVSSYIFVMMNTKFKLVHYIGLAATAAYFGYTICSEIKMCYNKYKIKGFITSIEHLFSVTKKTISFILESEFLLRSKIIKDQPLYVPSSGWVNPSTKEGLKYSGLILPELRRTLLTVYLDIINIFHNFLKSMKENLLLKTNVDSYMYITEPLDEFYDLQNQIRLAPSSDDLKELNNIYLVTQSECLKRLIFCFVESLWVNKSSYGNLDIIVLELIRYVGKFTTHATELELQYQKCINELKNNNVQLRKSGILKAGNLKDKQYTFINNFLSKADAHMLSLLLDLRMISNWINESEENNKDNDNECSNELITTLHDRLQIMKGNIQGFINLYNDNCNILKSMTHSTLENYTAKDSDTVDDKSARITQTGIEVGRSEFDITGTDEVLISLSNTDIGNHTSNTCDVDYDDNIAQKCLPSNVLDELKFALKSKKEEWIEREKKATSNSDVTIANLDFDNLLNSNENDYKKAKTRGELNWNSTSCKRRSLTYDRSYSSDEKDLSSLDHSENDASCSNEITNENHEVNAMPSTSVGGSLNSYALKNKSTLDAINTDSDDSVKKNLNSNVYRSPKSFVDQLKFAQMSFNLNMTEEEFLEGCSDEDEISS